MIIFPAVDIKGGRCVRLKKGRSDQETVFADDPVEAALHWQCLGAQWLHLVDLDGAFAGEPVNLPLIARLCASLSIPVQMGGGIRSLECAEAYCRAGVTRLIIGTLALEHPEDYARMCAALPGKIGVSLDTEGNRLKTKGWVADSGLCIDDVLPRLHEQGTAFIIHTDIERDGMQSGVNLQTLTDLAKKSPIPVIAAGGVANLADLQKLYPLSLESNLQGAITGRALYEGSLDLKEALDWLRVQGSNSLTD
ncbi:MAG: 1-(5-phosphoribosyl)-5-[(5-phosphoribosylamino)methylideneamino]imidazole-4-carboxamide isomerase [Desulfovibrio sp.]|nr:1-(5-phosphoribosyl)-5-[(5-phosphoribosylamino)methylideneamino]imidazole-4-carboxamide isomerase [Desulfovibrio sp.]